jgi:hypothetical protein
MGIIPPTEVTDLLLVLPQTSIGHLPHPRLPVYNAQPTIEKKNK